MTRIIRAGVPKFFRFISERYPLINSAFPASPPAIDNLYLDMNGIIHKCVYSSPCNGGRDSARYATLPPAHRTPEDIYVDVFKYVDNIVSMLPPRRLLYFAVDGVAPRAKMNQQRGRRFRSAKERRDEHERKLNQDPMYAAANVEPFDSNCITPGTEFMTGLSTALRYFVSRKITEDLSWADITVVLSGAESPGEGEHKIMEYIRTTRESGNMPANTRHCVYGLDADLIMLALVTHEPHFFLLREKIDFSLFWRKKTGPRVATPLDLTTFGEFELMSIGVLREYIGLEIGADGNSRLPFFDIDRVVDDFVFIIMLIGNDFLPNLPTLDIADGTLGVMLHLYKRLLPYLGGYLTNSGKISPKRFEFFLSKLAMLEEEVLTQRREESPSGRGRRRGGRGRAVTSIDYEQVFALYKPDEDELPEALSETELEQETLSCRAMLSHSAPLTNLKREYYAEKFSSDFNRSPEHLQQLVEDYVEGICWTLKYYVIGCRQWRWFYAHHYAPLASDMIHIAQVIARSVIVRPSDLPFRPLEQLLSVLPPTSAWCLPKPYRELMTNPTSPILDQYPAEFQTDMNGKKNDWEAVVLLPFVDEARLLHAIEVISEVGLSTEEESRNQLGPSLAYCFSETYRIEMGSPVGHRMSAFISHAEEKEMRFYAIEEGTPFSSKLLPGTSSAGSTEALGDLPTLSILDFTSELRSIGVNVFGNTSRSDSIVLFMDFDHSESEGTSSDDNGPVTNANFLQSQGISVGSPVWYGYPWREAGFVRSVADEAVTRQLVAWQRDVNSPPEWVVEESQTAREVFEQNTKTVVSHLHDRYAISVSKPTQLVSIQVDGGSSRVKSKDELVLCHDRMLRKRISRESFSERSSLLPLREGQSLLYVGHGAYFGHKCTILSLYKNQLVKVRFDHPAAAAREHPFGYRVVSSSQSQRWMTLSRLASELGLNVGVVDALLGTLRVRQRSDKDELDLGLGVKYIIRALYVPGYARRDERNFFSFSEKTLALLKSYQSSFPALFSSLETLKRDEIKGSGRSKGVPVYSSSDLFPKLKQPDDAARAAAAWLAVQDVSRQPLVPTSSYVLPRDAITELEKHCSIVLALQRDYEQILEGEITKTIKDVSRSMVVTGKEGLDQTSFVNIENTSNQYYEPVSSTAHGLRLGDRVVNRLGKGGVPFANRGTVVGIHYAGADADTGSKTESKSFSSHASVEVVFDETFISGGSLNGRCSEGRGKAVPANSLFIIRPERDNIYYSRNYARVAEQISSCLARQERESREKDTYAGTIAGAAKLSYSDAVKSVKGPDETGGKSAKQGGGPPMNMEKTKRGESSGGKATKKGDKTIASRTDEGDFGAMKADEVVKATPGGKAHGGGETSSRGSKPRRVGEDYDTERLARLAKDLSLNPTVLPSQPRNAEWETAVPKAAESSLPLPKFFSRRKGQDVPTNISQEMLDSVEVDVISEDVSARSREETEQPEEPADTSIEINVETTGTERDGEQDLGKSEARSNTAQTATNELDEAQRIQKEADSIADRLRKEIEDARSITKESKRAAGRQGGPPDRRRSSRAVEGGRGSVDADYDEVALWHSLQAQSTGRTRDS